MTAEAHPEARITERLSAQEVIDRLQLVPLPGEGGYYRETYRGRAEIPPSALPPGYAAPQPRSIGTAIYFLLTNAGHSALHRLPTDEIYHFYLGDAVALSLFDEPGSLQVVTLGGDLASGQHCQCIVPAGVWQSARVIPPGRWALLGTTMAPGFDFADLELADKATLARFPHFACVLEPMLSREG
jgi:predicted cupin superfamily sugar epimerase